MISVNIPPCFSHDEFLIAFDDFLTGIQQTKIHLLGVGLGGILTTHTHTHIWGLNNRSVLLSPFFTFQVSLHRSLLNINRKRLPPSFYPIPFPIQSSFTRMRHVSRCLQWCQDLCSKNSSWMHFPIPPRRLWSFAPWISWLTSWNPCHRSKLHLAWHWTAPHDMLKSYQFQMRRSRLLMYVFWLIAF